MTRQITQKENEDLEELRQRLKEEIEPKIYSDKYLFLRFLRAQASNINNAEAMLRKHLVWRKENDTENIIKWKKTEVVEKYCTYVILGHDKDGCVIRYCPLGDIDVLGILASSKPKDMVNAILYETETDTLELKKQSEKLRKNVDQCIYICNLQNFSLAMATSKEVFNWMIYTLQIFVNNYPERLKAGYIINASMYLNLLFSVLKTVLPITIMDKLHFYSDDSYKEDLLKVIDADVLPAFLGGNKTDPDGNPHCVSLIKPTEPVPRTYYLKKGKRQLSKASDVQKVVLSRATFHEVKIDVEETGSHIEWEFETKCRDIGFGLFYSEIVDEEEKITNLVPIQRIDTELYPETGTLRCDRPGKYVIVFDNTYSWVRAKEIYFRTRVLTPKELEAQQCK